MPHWQRLVVSCVSVIVRGMLVTLDVPCSPGTRSRCTADETAGLLGDSNRGHREAITMKFIFEVRMKPVPTGIE